MRDRNECFVERSLQRDRLVVSDEKGERIDILVPCAGTVGALGPVYERTEEEIDTVLTLHARHRCCLRPA